jgi:hypothetical protein
MAEGKSEGGKIMSLYAIGDLHLSFSVDKPMDVFGREWKNHVVKIEKRWKKKIKSEDTVVLTGDHSWGRNLKECEKDLEFISGLPGRKILLRGNHSIEHFEMLVEREMTRLKTSFELAKKDGYEKFLMFLHYPPTSIGENESPFTNIAEQYGVEKVIYSHCHGEERFQDSFLGEVNGVEYQLVSSDYLRFRPALIIK